MSAGSAAGPSRLGSSPMVTATSPQLQSELEAHVANRTARRIRNLAIEVDQGRVVLRGRTSSYYVKQLAQHGVRELLPQVSLENSIVVEPPAVLPPAGLVD
jgi:osmotically-inducible protein OsmY